LVIATTDAEMKRDGKRIIPNDNYHGKIPRLRIAVFREDDIFDALEGWIDRLFNFGVCDGPTGLTVVVTIAGVDTRPDKAHD